MYKRRIAILIFYNPHEEILLQHRDANASYYPGYWGFFGGGIEGNETPEEAVIREISEELQIKLSNARLFKRYEIQEEDGLCERFVFLSPIKESLEVLKSKQQEGDDIGLFSLEATQLLKTVPTVKIIFDEVFDYIRKMEGNE
ncbi:MAG: NUDIX domain-containing protein [Candidatus Woesebacteria bacterium]